MRVSTITRLCCCALATASNMNAGVKYHSEYANVKDVYDFAERALASPALLPHMMPRPHGGMHEFTFSLYGAADFESTNDCILNPDCFGNLTASMRATGVANGLDPFSFLPVNLSVEHWRAVAALGWPTSVGPLSEFASCFQVPGCENNMTKEHHDLLAIFDAANIYSEILCGEIGNFMAILRPAAPCPWDNCSGFPAPGSSQPGSGNVNWWHDDIPNQLCNASICAGKQWTFCHSAQNWTNTSLSCSNSCCNYHDGPGNLTNDTRFQLLYTREATPTQTEDGRPLKGFRTMPASRREAYEYYRAYYNERVRTLTSVGDEPYQPFAKVYPVTCHAHLEHYAALWSS